MVKNKKTPTQRHKITTIFGYTLFAVSVLLFLLSTAIPMTSVLFQYPNARHFNIIVIVVVFAIATVMPALVAYFIGDSTTRSKKETLHRYNGVLFGFLAYWMVMLMSWIDLTRLFGLSEQSFPAGLVTTNIPPVVVTLISVVILAVAFAKKQKNNTSVLQFLPYQITLLISMSGALAAPYVVRTASVNLAGALFLVVPALITALTYAVLRKQHSSKLARLIDALLALSIFWITSLLASSALPFIFPTYQVAGGASVVVGAVILGLYLYLRVRK